MSNRVDLIKRGMQLQADKIDILWDYIQTSIEILAQYEDALPEELIEDYNVLLYKFLSDYRTLVGKRGIDEQEENEQN